MVFDLDGTLAETGRDLARSINFMRRKLGLPNLSEEEIKSFVGDGVKELVVRSLGEKGELYDKAIEIFLDHYRSHLLDSTYLHPGVEECLEHFREKRKVVLSNKRQEFVEKIISAFNLQSYFVEIIGGDKCPFMKPNPRLVVPLLEKYSVHPERAVIIGDGINDILLAKRAGMISCAYLNGLTKREKLLDLKADYYCDSLREIKDFFL